MKPALLLVVAALLSAPRLTQASTPVTYLFSGELVSVDGVPDLAVGDAFHGRFSYDADTPDSHFSIDPMVGFYEEERPRSVGQFSVEIGGLSYELEADGRLVLIVSQIPAIMEDHVAVETTHLGATLPQFPSVNYIEAALNLRALPGLLVRTRYLVTLIWQTFRGPGSSS
jgi:hypothetical protein